MSSTSKLIMIIVLILIFTLVSGECPPSCHCTRYKTFCSLAKLRSLPSALPSTTEHLRIELDHISHINSSIIAYSGLHRLIHLELVNVNLQEIEPGAFQNMSQLEYLAITYNRITVLKTNSFKYLENLYFLNLSYNEISDLESGTFSGLPNLRHLDLGGNGILSLKANVFKGIRTSDSCDRINLPLTYIYQSIYWYIDYEFEPIIVDYLCTFTYFNIHLHEQLHIPPHTGAGLALNNNKAIVYKNVKRAISWLLYLDMVRLGISRLSSRSFQNLKKLTYLDISFNFLKEIPRNAFEGLISLRVLKLNNNKISSLSNGAFQGLGSLKYLQMAYCRIRIIESNAFEGLTRLQLLDLSGNNKHILKNNTFSGLHMLKDLRLRQNTIKRIDSKAFSDLTNLKSLTNTYRNRLNGSEILMIDTDLFMIDPEFPERFIENPLYNLDKEHILKLFNTRKETFLNMDRLDSLALTAHITLPQDIQVIKMLNLYIHARSVDPQQLVETVRYAKDVYLTLIGDNTTQILKTYSQFQISKLTLINSDFRFLDSSSLIDASVLKSLTVYSMNNYSIEQGALQEMKSLTELILHNGLNLIYTQGSFYRLHNLRHLSIFDYNGQIDWYTDMLSSIEIHKCLHRGTFQELQHLKQLEFMGNRFTCLSPGAFQGLYNVEKIYFNYNYIAEINAGVFGAVCQEKFELSCKNVTLSEYCNNTNALTTLKYLDLSYNNITHIQPHAFIACNNLQTLVLSDNKFLTLDNSFLFIPVLKKLDMMSCNITNIPDNTFECTPLLSEINFLDNTKLNKITLNSLLPLKHLKFLELRFASLICNCELYELWLWMRQRNIQYNIYDNKYRNKTYCGNRKIDKVFSIMDCNNTQVQTSIRKNITAIRDDFEFFKLYIEPIVLIIILIFGLACNGFLLFISLRHSDICTKQNTLVIHLAIVDVLSLIINLPLSYWDTVNIIWEFDDILCKIFTLSKDMLAGVVVFSVLALSIERFLVTRTFKNLNKTCISEKLPTIWFLMMTWISGIVTSYPAYLSAVIVDGRCLYCPPGNQDYIRNVWTFQLVMYCLVPAVAITFFNIKTSLFLRESVHRIPGEIKSNYCAQHRITVANIVLILAAVFIISSLPNYILRVLVAWSVIDMKNIFLPSFFTFCLFFCNTVFNPISLFIMSSKLNYYFLIYFPFLGNEQNLRFQ